LVVHRLHACCLRSSRPSIKKLLEDRRSLFDIVVERLLQHGSSLQHTSILKKSDCSDEVFSRRLSVGSGIASVWLCFFGSIFRPIIGRSER
jgi:hypothetical protein